MKLMLILTAVWCLNIHASIFSQVIPVQAELQNTSIKDVLNAIEAASDVRFFYNDGFTGLDKKVNVSLDNNTLEQILSPILKSAHLTYHQVDNKFVVITPASMNEKFIERFSQPRTTIKGIVSDNAGDPMPGVNVIIKGTTTGVITSVDGQYSIPVTDKDAVLVFSFIGYATQEIVVGDRQEISIIMEEDTHDIEEVVVVGYGSQKKVNLSGAVSTVKMDDVLKSRPVASTSQVLEGAVPGLLISRNNGKPGVDMNLNIRGVTSINNSNSKPLVLVDHVPMDIEMLDPNDIESVSVLKDAAAAAIYGARAAFGIILITTKKGARETPLTVNYSNNFAFSKPATLPKKIDPYSTVKVYNDLGLENYWGGQKVSKWLDFMDGYYNKGLYPEGYVMNDGYRYNLAGTDAYKDLMDNYGFQQQHNLALSGGSSSITYHLSFGMVDEDGVLITDKDKYTRYNAGGFISVDAAKWLTGQMDVRYSDATTSTAMAQSAERGGTVIWQTATDAQPMAPSGYGEKDGQSYPYSTAANFAMIGAPKIAKANNTRLLGRAIIKPFDGLEVIGEYSFYRTGSETSYAPKLLTMMNTVTGDVKTELTRNYYELTERSSTTGALNTYATYSKRIQDHDFKIMGGFNQEQGRFDYLYTKKEDMINQDKPSYSQSTGAMIIEDYDPDYSGEYSLRSFFYRINYTFKDRYIIETNGRYDGSSRFSSKERFGFFPSVSAAWRVSEEPFMDFSRTVLSNLKFRGSWGTIGNQNVDFYGYYQIMNPYTTTTDTKSNWILPDGTNFVTSLAAPILVNNPYTWEKVETLDFGVDFGLFNNRLTTTFDWYQRNTKGMLIESKPMPSVLGSKPPKTNAADLRTNGWELMVEWKSQIGEDIHYNIGVNFFDSQSKITRYDNPTGELFNSENEMNFRKGMKFGEIWGYTTDRFYTANDFIDANDPSKGLKDGIPKWKGSVPNPGDILYKNFDNNTAEISNGDNNSENPGDMKVIGNTSSRYQFGITGGFSYKNFDFSFFLNGTMKRDIWMPGYWAPSGTFVTSVFDFQQDYWSEGNQDSYWPRIYGSGGNDGFNNKIQTKYLQNGAFLRIKNITVGYTLPKSICSKIYLKNLRVFAGIENLYTWHHLPKGFYPDSYVATPGSRKMNPGVGGNDSGTGIWSYPLMRQISFGLNLTF